MSDERINVNVGAHTQNLEQGMKRAGESVAHGTAYMRESFKGLGELVERIKVPLVSFFALFEGGELFKDAIQQTEELGVQLTVLAQKTGMGVEQLSKLQFAAKASHVDAGALDVGLRQLARSMEEAMVTKTAMSARAFAAMGIQLKDAHGQTKSLGTVLGEVADKFSHYADGAQKTAIAQAILGRSGSDLIPVLNQGAAGIKDLGDEADHLGAVMTGPQAEAAARYEDGMMKMKEATAGLVRTLVVGILPSMTAAAEKTAALVPKLKECTDVAIALAAAIGAAGVTAAFRVLATTISTSTLGAFVSLVAGIGSLADALAAAQLAVEAFLTTLGPVGLIAAGVGAVTYAFLKLTNQVDDADAAAKRLNATLAETINKGDVATLAEKKYALEVGTAANNYQDGLKSLEEKLAQVKQRYALFHLPGQAAQMMEIQKEIDARLAQIKVLDEAMKKAAKVGAGVGTDKPKPPAPDFKDDTGTEKEQAIESPAMKALQKRLAEQQKAWTKYFAAVKKANDENDKELTETTAANQKSEQTYLDRQLKAIREANKQGAEDYQKTLDKIAGQWAHAFNVITDTVKKSVDGLIQGTLTMRMAWENLGRNLVLSFASSELQMVQQHAAAELAKRHITEQSVLARIASESFGAAKTIAIHAAATVQWLAIELAAAMKSLAIHAGSAFMGMTDWLAAKIGPFAPLVAGAATLAAVATGLSFMHSAAGGYDVPAGVNPVTQLHAQEMVLPKEYANVIRGMAQGGGGGGGDVHLHVHTMDVKGVKQFLSDNRDHLADALKRAHKEGRVDV